MQKQTPFVFGGVFFVLLKIENDCIFMLQENVSLRSLNTFGLDCTAKHYAWIRKTEDLFVVLASSAFQNRNDLLVLGGGSNILLTHALFDGFVLHMQTKGITCIEENERRVRISVAAGEIWEDFVAYCVNKGWGGIENLAAIPGTVGAAPIQNIGAYGVEVKDAVAEVHAVEVASGHAKIFHPSECHFGYRQSIFKQQRGKYIVTEVVFELNKQPSLQLTYGAISEELNRMNAVSPSIKDVSKAVTHIRNAKLPDYKLLGNAGSFFTNPVVPNSEYERLKQCYPSLSSFPAGKDHRKISAGWLIENAGWKGKRLGNVGMYEKQALILVNYGNASAENIIELCNRVIQDVENKFGIRLESEVNRY